MYFEYKNQRGVILVMTIVIMSILLATGLGFAVLVLSDLRQARQIDDGIVAYHAANAGIEEGLYWLRKDSAGADIATVDALKDIATTRSLANNALWDISDSTNYQNIISRERLYNGQSLKFYILGRSGPSPINTTQSIRIEWERDDVSPTTQLQIVATQLNYQQKDGALIYYTDINEVIANPDPVGDCVALRDEEIAGNPDTDYDYVFEVRALGELESDVIKSLRVQAYNEDDCTVSNDQGITNISLVSIGRYRTSQQTINAYVPPRDPVSGLFGFVLFSQEDITKDNE